MSYLVIWAAWSAASYTAIKLSIWRDEKTWTVGDRRMAIATAIIGGPTYVIYALTGIILIQLTRLFHYFPNFFSDERELKL